MIKNVNIERTGSEHVAIRTHMLGILIQFPIKGCSCSSLLARLFDLGFAPDYAHAQTEERRSLHG